MSTVFERWLELSDVTRAFLVGVAWWWTACITAVLLGRWIHRRQGGDS